MADEEPARAVHRRRGAGAHGGVHRGRGGGLSEATLFHLVRHASYGLLGRVLAGRTAGHALDATGRAEAVRLADTLAGRTIAAIVASPLERTQETAAAIATPRGLPVATDPALVEIDFGAWTGSALDALHGTEAWRRYNAFRGTACSPGGETMLAVQARVVGAMVRLREAHPGGEVVLVSHADVIKAALAHFLAVPLDLFQRIEIAPASRSVIRLGADWVRVEGINLPPAG